MGNTGRMMKEIVCPTCGTEYAITTHVRALHGVCWACGETVLWDQPPEQSQPRFQENKRRTKRRLTETG